MTQLYRRPTDDELFADEVVWDITGMVPVEPQECKLMRSEPKTLGSGEVVYEITLVSNEPANSLTMHNSVWLIGETP